LQPVITATVRIPPSHGLSFTDRAFCLVDWPQLLLNPAERAGAGSAPQLRPRGVGCLTRFAMAHETGPGQTGQGLPGGGAQMFRLTQGVELRFVAVALRVLLPRPV